MSQNEVPSVPRMLPAVEIEDKAPADRPMCANPLAEASLTPSGVTIASSSEGRKKISAEAARAPARGPRSAAHGRTGTATIGATIVSTPAAAMIGASVREAPNRSARWPPIQ